jgi:predicted secreted protein
VLLIPIALLAGACGDDDDDDAAADDTPAGEEVNDIVVYGEAEDTSTVTHEVGDTFDLALEQCIGCGYAWRVVTEPDEVIVALIGEDDVGGPEEEGAVGGMGEHVFHWSVAGAGVTTLEVGYFPPGGTDPETTITLTVEAT